ncbi:MAG: hypothetical protein M1404_01965 [Acidobacteria bacterium]|nr:hypothetical protein [Acidobacteriota bacterium]
MRKGELVISTILAALVICLVLALQRNWHANGLKKVASSAEQLVLGKSTPPGGYPDIPGYQMIHTYYLDREYRAALYRSNSVTLGFAPGHLVIYNHANQPVYKVDTLEGAREAWTALYDFAGRHGLPVRGGSPRPIYTRDLTADGKQELVIGQYSGGDRCCTTVTVLEIEKTSLRTIGRIEGLGGWPFEDLEIRRIGRSPQWELVVHRPQITACGSRENAADVIAVYAYSDGKYTDQTLRFSEYLQGVLRENLAKWSREKNPPLGLLQSLAAQYGVLGQPDRAKKFFAENMARFLPQMKEQGFDPIACREDLDSLVDRLAKPQSSTNSSPAP